jgi:hypothetical protein
VPSKNIIKEFVEKITSFIERLKEGLSDSEKVELVGLIALMISYNIGKVLLLNYLSDLIFSHLIHDIHNTGLSNITNIFGLIKQVIINATKV